MCKRVFLSVLTLLLIGGCQNGKSGMTDAELERVALTQRIELVEAEGGLVLVVGGETVTSNEIIESRGELNRRFVSPIEHFKPLAQTSDFEQFKTQARVQLEGIIMGRISSILLYQHAKREAGKNIDEILEKAADNELRKFVLDFGGDQAKADEELEQRGMDRKSFKEQQKKLILRQLYRGSKLYNDRPITYRELIDCYDEIKDEHFARVEKITFRLIDIQPAKLEMTDPNLDPGRLAEYLARQLLERIRSGEDFGELAKQYSHGHRKAFGGLWEPVQPQSLAAPYDLIAAQAENTEPGRVAEPIVAQGHVFIMKLEEKQSAGYEPFEEVQELVERKVLIDRHNKVLDQLNAELMEEAKLGKADEFVDFCLKKIYQRGRQQ